MEELIINERKFREDFANLINNAILPAIILKPILKDMFEQLTIQEQQQYELAIKNIEKKGEQKDE
jgi:hypothetical protein